MSAGRELTVMHTTRGELSSFHCPWGGHVTDATDAMLCLETARSMLLMIALLTLRLGIRRIKKDEWEPKENG